MYFPDPAILGAANETTALLLLLWQELFDEASPDTFQPKLYDIPSLVEEIYEVAELTSESELWAKHLNEIKKELTVNVRANASLLARFSKYHWSLEHLLTVKDFYALRLNARQLAAQAPGISDFFAGFYAGNLQAALSGMPRTKGDLVTAVNNLASCATRAGSTRSALRSLVSDEMFRLSPEEAATTLSNGCSPPAVEYRFVVPVEGNISHLQSILQHAEGLKLLRRDELPAGETAAAFFAAHARARFVGGETRATGHVAAANLALRLVRPLGDTFNFFGNRLFLSFGSEVLLAVAGVCMRVNLAEQSLQRLHPRNDARQLTQAALLPPLRQKLEGRLSNAIELYSLALAATSTRVRLVNLWSALECLQGNLPETSIIERAVSLVAPLMTWRRVEKMVRYLAICLHEYREKYSLVLPQDGGFEHATRFTVQVEDLLHILTKPEGHDHPVKLATFAGGHALLRYRLFCAWQSLSQPGKLHKELEESEERVRWQLFRIYRARNLTVHHGVDAHLVTPMLDTLQYYLSVVLTRIVRTLARHPGWEMDDTIAGLLREAAYVRQTLQRSPCALATCDLISEPRFRQNELLWPSS